MAPGRTATLNHRTRLFASGTALKMGGARPTVHTRFSICEISQPGNSRPRGLSWSTIARLPSARAKLQRMPMLHEPSREQSLIFAAPTRGPQFQLLLPPATLAQVSRSPTVRLNTSRPGTGSASRQK